ncbi:hypothetical protein IKF92_00030 [Candidatus Saccharibacteria bacterium]|nr:hypothetical protein [Candidatus Saccharibacteria bacterium]
MGTQKTKKSSKPKRHVTVKSKKGVKYDGIVENGEVKITEERTAPGQKLRVGILNIETKMWSERVSIPNEVKRDFEFYIFGEPILE